MSDSLAALLRLLAVVAAIAALWFFGRETVHAIQAPAELKAARANNMALKSEVDAQNKAVDALAMAAAARKEKSAAAVNAAGGVQFKRADEIRAAPAQGESDYERAMNRIDRELGLR